MIYRLFIFVIFIITTLASYDQNLARNVCGYSAITHCNTTLIETWNCKLCSKLELLQDIVHIENKVTQVYGYISYSYTRNRIVIIWRGSHDTTNWIEDISFQTNLYPKCKNCQVHAGFQFSYLSVEARTNELVAKYLQKYPTATIVVGGHSLGGALAMFCAVTLQLKFNKVSELYTLGQPRLGNLNLAKFINSKIPNIYRIIHNRDLVPHVPFQFLEYHHAYSQVYYNADMTSYKICDNSGEDPSCSNKLFPNFDPADHDFYFYGEDQSAC